MIRNDVVNTLEFPAPKFHLGQSVTCEFEACGKQQCRQGIVIGLEYLSIQFALVDQTGICGWRYTISSMVGKSDSEWLKVKDSYDVHWDAAEEEMTSIEDSHGVNNRTNGHIPPVGQLKSTPCQGVA